MSDEVTIVARHPAERIWRSPVRQLLVIAGLSGFAISQPVLGLLGDAPTILARYGIEGPRLVGLAVVIAFVPPLLAWGGSRLAAMLDERLGRVLHLVAVGALAACFAIQVAKSLGLAGPFLLLVAAAMAAAAFVVAYVRLAAVATWASYTSILPILAVGSFLLASPASALLTSPEPP